MPQLEFATFVPQIVWLVITFLALYVIMSKIAVPKIAEVLEARQKKIDDNLERAQELRKEAEAAMAAYEQALSEARSKAHAEIAKVGQELAEKADAQEAKLAAELDAKIAESEAAIDAAMQDALKNVEGMAVEVAQTACQQLTGDAPNPATVEKAVAQQMKA